MKFACTRAIVFILILETIQWGYSSSYTEWNGIKMMEKKRIEIIDYLNHYYNTTIQYQIIQCTIMRK